MTRPLNTALFGCGKIGAGYAADPVMARHYRYTTHAQVLQHHPRFAFTAAVDRDAAAANAVQAQFGAAVAGTGVEALDRESIEVAVLATPPGERLAIIKALPRLRAILVEKPVGATRAEAEALIAYCAGRGIAVQVALPRRVDAAHRALAEGGLTDRVGAVQGAFIVYGNGLMNNATHMVDLARMLLGEIDEVSVPASLSPRREGPIGNDVNVPFVARLASGQAVMALPLAFAHYRENALDIWGERGRVALVQEGLRLVKHPRTENRAMRGERELINDAGTAETTTIGEAFLALYDDLAAALEAGRTPHSSGDNALRTARVIDAILTSAASGMAQRP